MPAFLTKITRRLNPKSAILSLVMVTGFMIALCVAYEPRFETNDDVAMSMIAHGYGDAAYGSPLVIYSNVLWGYLIRATPTIGGVLGYSVATFAVLMVAGWAIAHFLSGLGAGFLSAFLAASLVLFGPTLLPQFTINAGLLTVAAVVGWKLYALRGGIGTLGASCMLVFVGYLVRDHECALVLAVASPLFPWRVLRERREAQIAFLMLAVAIAGAMAVNHLSYSGPEWKRYFEVKKALTSIAAWGYGEDLKQHPEILTRHGYTKNDIELIENAFWVDPQISDPEPLSAMMAQLDSDRTQHTSIAKGIADLRVLIDPRLLPLMLAALVLLILKPQWSVAFSWALCISAVIVFAVLGRPSIVRIYIPLASLLLLAPLASSQPSGRFRRWLTVITICGGWLVNAYVLMPQGSESTRRVQEFQRDFRGVPAGTIVNWANSIHHEFPFALLATDPSVRAIRLYDISAFAFAPFSVAAAEQAAGRGLKEKLQTAEGIAMFTPYSYLWKQLQVYCLEHLGSQLQGEFTFKSPSISVQQVRCVAPE